MAPAMISGLRLAVKRGCADGGDDEGNERHAAKPAGNFHPLAVKKGLSQNDAIGGTARLTAAAPTLCCG